VLSSSRVKMSQTMDNPFLKFEDNIAALSSRAKPPKKKILLGHLDP
jgi:hypothetical protein